MSYKLTVTAAHFFMPGKIFFKKTGKGLNAFVRNKNFFC